jgi:hypothetical protein
MIAGIADKTQRVQPSICNLCRECLVCINNTIEIANPIALMKELNIRLNNTIVFILHQFPD